MSVAFDGLVEALRCRQTDAEWSYRYLEEHSTVESLGVADNLTAQIPEPALLFALKLHSGRLADTRDLVVVGSDAEFERIERHLHRGDPDKLADQIERLLGEVEQAGFEDSFKGVFQQKKLPEGEIDAMSEFLRTQLDRL
jgi:hypothetical protein